MEIAETFKELLKPSRYKACWGGRGSGKSHVFAELMILKCLTEPGSRCVCIREVQKTLKESAKKLLEDKIHSLGAGNKFLVLNDRILGPGGGLIIFQGMQDHTAESIKSLEGFKVAWVEEAQSLSETSLRLLRPTIRSEGSEIWFSWNPRLKTDPVDILFRQQTPPTNSIVIKANWSDNPWFPNVLEQERKDALNNEPDQYEHIWEGGYVTVSSGAYFAKHLAKAKSQGRITDVPEDPLLIVRLYADIGGTGAKSDNFVFWAAQFQGLKINFINHYESQGQPIGAHINWLRSQDYTPDRVKIWLPHDGETNDKVLDINYRKAFENAGYKVEVVKNQGKGAAKARIEQARNLFLKMWFDHKCQGGIEALGWYHEKRDPNRNIGLGPEHDWSSHSCLPSGVKVSTARGLIEIQNVKSYDFVNINGVYARVTNSGYVKHSETMTIELTTGEILECTPEHKIFTSRGLLKADELSCNDLISTERSPLWNIQKLSIAGIRKSISEISLKDLSSAQGHARVSHITRNKKLVPVYDITVEKQQCYYANGFLVSNSDAFGLAAIAYEEPKAKKEFKQPRIGMA